MPIEYLDDDGKKRHLRLPAETGKYQIVGGAANMVVTGTLGALTATATESQAQAILRISQEMRKREPPILATLRQNPAQPDLVKELGFDTIAPENLSILAGHEEDRRSWKHGLLRWQIVTVITAVSAIVLIIERFL